jgi:hypothetical protein
VTGPKCRSTGYILKSYPSDPSDAKRVLVSDT